MIYFRQSVVALVVLSMPLGLTAQARPRDTTVALPGMAVTATRTPASILTTPLAITKITAPELRGVSGFGVDEALKLVPGVLAQSRYGTSDIRLVIRGSGARGAGDRSNAAATRGVRILIDGIPETEPDGRTSLDQVDLGTASAVEIIRSNASATWGNASGGVLNILTTPVGSDPQLDLQPIFGGFGLKRYVAHASAPAGSGTVYSSYTNTSFEGWRGHSAARRTVANAGFTGFLGDKTHVGVFASGANNLFQIPGPLTQAQMDADPLQANATYLANDERRYNRVVRLATTVDRELNDEASISGMLFASPKFIQRSERGSFRDFTRFHVGGNVIGRYDMKMSDHKVSHIVVGVDEAYQDGAILFYSLSAKQTRGTTLADNKAEGANNLGFFIQDEIPLSDRVKLTLGGRSDRVTYNYRNYIDPTINASKDFTHVTPKLGLSWLMGTTRSVYANVGGGVEVPAGNEVDPGPTGGTSAISALLEPITSTTFEIGTKSVGSKLGSTPVTVGYDVALYDTEVKNDIQPYNGGRYYMTAGKSRRTGLEVGVNAWTMGGLFANTALTFSNNTYIEYVVDSSQFKVGGQKADFGGNEIVGVPDVIANVELGTEIPGYRAARLKVGLEHVGSYFADDANTVNVNAFSIVNLTAELRNPILASNGYGVRGFITMHNVADTKYVGSAFLNPNRVAGTGAPIAYEPGMPRTVVVSFTVGRMK